MGVSPQVRRYERVETLVELTRGPRVLHVGCCNNRLPVDALERTFWVHDALIAAGHSVVGADINEERLAWMESQGYAVVHLDAQAMEEYDGRFDSIVAGELIEHLENPGLFLQGSRKLLKPGGRLVLSTPNVFSIMWALMYAKKGTHAFHPEHTCWFCPQTLAQLMGRAGFRIEELRYVDSLLPQASYVGRSYRAFAHTWLRIRGVLPDRYRNTLVVSAVAVDE
jgi:2-polyprenyl-3-methyl-5-hydroxy-6-metoxy-1,4-benzoquinol methylase